MHYIPINEYASYKLRAMKMEIETAMSAVVFSDVTLLPIRNHIRPSRAYMQMVASIGGHDKTPGLGKKGAERGSPEVQNRL